MDKQLNKDDALSKMLAENLETSVPLNFTDKVMEKVEAEIAKRKVVQPLVGKSTWIAIGFFILTILILPFFIENTASFESSLDNLSNYGSNLLTVFNSIWVYLAIGIVALWELLFRRILKFS